jgi:metallo-beta-lactamase class B
MAEILLLHPGAALHCQVRALVTPAGLALVDAGSGAPAEAARLLAALAAAGYPPAAVRWVLLTHAHVDHVCGAAAWQRRGARSLASPAAAARLAAAAPAIWREHPERLAPLRADRELADGEALDLGGVRVDCLATPGHTPGGMSYLVETEEARWAFSGDLVMPDGTPGWAGDPAHSAAQTRRSLQRIAARAPQRIATGHGLAPGPAGAFLRRVLA